MNCKIYNKHNHISEFLPYDMERLVFVKDFVIKGFGRGSKQLGCPTANVANIEHLTISTGIYCGLVQMTIHNKEQCQLEPGHADAYERLVSKLPYTSPVKPMVASFGYNPHFGNKSKSLEVHIIDNIEYNFYGAELRVLICKKMRDEEKYNSLEELKSAIACDIQNAKSRVSEFESYKSDTNYFIATHD